MGDALRKIFFLISMIAIGYTAGDLGRALFRKREPAAAKISGIHIPEGYGPPGIGKQLEKVLQDQLVGLECAEGADGQLRCFKREGIKE